MLRGFYTAASGMISQQRYQESLSNNIANANTPGYKADQSTMRAFPEMLMQQTGSKKVPTERGLKFPANHTVGPINTGVYVQEMVPNFGQGEIRETGNSTDLALANGQFPDADGGVFFTVQNAEGDVRLTRNGNFTVDGEGFLVTNEGQYVLDQADNRIPVNNSEFTVSEDGQIQTENQNFQLGISYVQDTNELAKDDTGLLNGATQAMPGDATYQVNQGHLEQSNVDEAQMMTQMTESYRTFEANQRVLKAYDESMGKAVSEIGRIG